VNYRDHCLPVTQESTVWLERDGAAGMVKVEVTSLLASVVAGAMAVLSVGKEKAVAREKPVVDGR